MSSIPALVANLQGMSVWPPPPGVFAITSAALCTLARSWELGTAPCPVACIPGGQRGCRMATSQGGFVMGGAVLQLEVGRRWGTEGGGEWGLGSLHCCLGWATATKRLHCYSSDCHLKGEPPWVKFPVAPVVNIIPAPQPQTLKHLAVPLYSGKTG